MRKRIAIIAAVSCAFVLVFAVLFAHTNEKTISVLLKDGTDVQKVEESINDVRGARVTGFYTKESERESFLNIVPGSEREELEFYLTESENPMKDRVAVNVRSSADLNNVIAAISSINGVAEVD